MAHTGRRTGDVKPFGECIQQVKAVLSSKKPKLRTLLELLREFCSHDRLDAASSPVCLPQTVVDICEPIFCSISSAKDSDDCRKCLGVAHYLMRRVLKSPHGYGIPKETLRKVVSALQNREMKHKHEPRRAAALRTLGCCLNTDSDGPSTSMLSLVREDLKRFLTLDQRLEASKKRKVTSACRKEYWCAQALTSVTAHIVKNVERKHADWAPSLESGRSDLLNYYLYGICCRSIAVARRCASQIVVLANVCGEEIAAKLSPLLPQRRDSALRLSDSFVCVRMLEVFTRLSKLSLGEGSKSQISIPQEFCEAIAYILVTDHRWRIRLCATRSLASVSWYAIEQTHIILDANCEVTKTSFVGGQGKGNTSDLPSGSVELALMDKLINQLSNGLKLGIRRLAKQHRQSESPPEDFHRETELKGREEDETGPSIIFVHTVLRTIADVGRSHAQYLAEVKYSALDYEGTSRGTAALRTTLAPNLWQLAINSSDSIRLQSLIALVWLTPVPQSATEKHSSSAASSTALDDLRLLLEQMPPLPHDLANELLNQFKLRVSLCPKLSPFILRWHHYSVGAAVKTSAIISIWSMCIKLGVESRNAVLTCLLSIVDGHHPMNDTTTAPPAFVAAYGSRTRLPYMRLRRSALWMLGHCGVELVASKVDVKSESKASLLDPSMNHDNALSDIHCGPSTGSLDEISRSLSVPEDGFPFPHMLQSLKMQQILSRLLASVQFDEWQDCRTSIVALISLGLHKYASITLRVVVYEVLTKLMDRLVGLSCSMKDILAPALDELDVILNDIDDTLQTGTWKHAETPEVDTLLKSIKEKYSRQRQIYRSFELPLDDVNSIPSGETNLGAENRVLEEVVLPGDISSDGMDALRDYSHEQKKEISKENVSMSFVAFDQRAQNVLVGQNQTGFLSEFEEPTKAETFESTDIDSTFFNTSFGADDFGPSDSNTTLFDASDDFGFASNDAFEHVEAPSEEEGAILDEKSGLNVALQEITRPSNSKFNGEDSIQGMDLDPYESPISESLNLSRDTLGSANGAFDPAEAMWRPAPGIEAALYESLFLQADTDCDGVISGNEGVAFLMRTGRSRDELQKVWEIASRGDASLSKDQFFEAVRLVHLAQNGKILGPDAAIKSSGLALPQAFRLTWSPTSSELRCFGDLFQEADVDQDGTISGSEGVSFLLKSGLSREQLRLVWDLASEGGPSLSHEQFCTAMRLVALLQAGHQIDSPHILTDTSLLILQPPLFSAGTALDQQSMYRTLWESVPKNNFNMLSQQEAVYYFRKSGLSNDTLRKIWSMVNSYDTGLDESNFFLALRLIAAAQQGQDIHILEKSPLDNMYLLPPKLSNDYVSAFVSSSVLT